MSILPKGQIPAMLKARMDWRSNDSGPHVLFRETQLGVDFCRDSGLEAIEAFLDHAVLLDENNQPLLGEDGRTIRQILAAETDDASYEAKITQADLFAAMHEDTLRYFDSIRLHRRNFEAAFNAGYYSGVIGTCCGIPGCGSTYIHMRNGKCDVRFEISGGSLSHIEFYPFELVD